MHRSMASRTTIKRSGESPDIAPIHPKLLLGGHSQIIRIFIRDDIGDAMVEPDVED